ncbi:MULTISPECIES: hypothetical protein [Mesorhizobium]|uniref:hypothetical protein n=1 Tax=Mesorhizobium TaxID=68287 RepID=UPI001140992A|nr:MULTISPECIES: hypothetical protein [Mesorhizobium]
MTKSFDFGNEPRQEEFSSLIAKEVQRVLVQHAEVMKGGNSTSSQVGPGNIAAADLLSAMDQQTIHDDLTALTSEFVRRLSAEACETAPRTAHTKGARECPVLKAQGQQSDSRALKTGRARLRGKPTTFISSSKRSTLMASPPKDEAQAE